MTQLHALRISIFQILAVLFLLTGKTYAAFNEQPQNYILSVGENQTLDLHYVPAHILIANTKVVDISYAENKRLFLIGKSIGETTISVWNSNKQVDVYRVQVTNNINSLLVELHKLYPNENKITINSLGDLIVISGEVSNSLIKSNIDEFLAKYTKSKTINLATVIKDPQISLDVKVIEIQKNYESKLGSQINGANSTKSISGKSNFNTSSLAQFSIVKGGITAILDAEINSSNAKILAQPNIVSVNGKPASFLAGGKLFIPIPMLTNTGVSAVSLQEENYGVSLKFTPNIVSINRVMLSIDSEVSELAVSSTTYGSGNNLTTIPTIMARKASTNLALNDGDSFIIGGLLQNNISKSIQAFPYLSDIPILGNLFKSTDFQENRTELIFVVTVHFLDNNESLNK